MDCAQTSLMQGCAQTSLMQSLYSQPIVCEYCTIQCLPHSLQTNSHQEDYTLDLCLYNTVFASTFAYWLTPGRLHTNLCNIHQETKQDSIYTYYFRKLFSVFVLTMGREFVLSRCYSQSLLSKGGNLSSPKYQQIGPIRDQIGPIRDQKINI